MTRDGLFHDLDLSSLVPGNTLVLIRLKINGSNAGDNFQIRNTDFTSTWNGSSTRLQVASKILEATVIVQTNASGVVEYSCPSTLTAVDIAVRGYWDIN